MYPTRIFFNLACNVLFKNVSNCHETSIYLNDFFLPFFENITETGANCFKIVTLLKLMIKHIAIDTYF